MLTLTVEDDQGRKTEVPVGQPGLTIGRDKDNQLRLNERNVSRKHARISLASGQVVIEDLDSYNGVRINGDRINGRSTLFSGDKIQLGDFSMQLHGAELRQRPEEITQKTQVPRREPGEEVTNTEPMVVAPVGNGAAPLPATKPNPMLDKNGNQARPPAPAARDDFEEHTALIRISDVNAQRTSAPAQALSGPNPRLFCVKGPMAGQQWPLSKTEVIIGRGQDCDVQVDHRSLSRQHARLTLSGQTYRIADMGSSNGTLVNGEQYAQVDLKRGDVIELGHIRLRVVWPGEPLPAVDATPDGAFDETTEIATRPNAKARPNAAPSGEVSGSQRSSNKGLFIALGVGALVAVVAMGMFVGLQSEPTTAQPQPVVANNGAQPNTPAQPAPTAATAQPVAVEPSGQPTATPDPVNKVDVQAVLRKANAEMGNEAWAQAVRILQTALEQQPGVPELRQALDRAEAESSAKTTFDSASAAMQRGDYQTARDFFGAIDENSVYWPRAQKKLSDPKLKNAGKPKTVVATAAEKPEPKPEPKVVEKVEKPVEKVAAVDKPKEDKTAAVSKPPAKPEDNPDAALSPREQAKKLCGQANKSLIANKHKEAIELYLEAARIDPKYALPHRGLGIAHAGAGNGDAAVEHYRTYLKLYPTAPDAEQVRKLIHDYEASE